MTTKPSSQWSNVGVTMYCVVVGLVKVSILLQYLRIFVPCRKTNIPLSITIHALIWSTTLFYFIMALTAINECTPRKKIWNPLMVSGHCLDTNAGYRATGLFNVFTDFAILIVPIVPLWKLQMSLSKKFRITAVFACGIL